MKRAKWVTRLFLALCLVHATEAASAKPVLEPYGPGLVRLSVIDPQSGNILRVWHRHHRYFIAAMVGDRYLIRIRNMTCGRVLVLVTVDGINVVTGETGAFGQHGHLLECLQSYDIPGWVKSTQEVAAFHFAPIAESYAARTDRPGNVGVIGMAVFEEKPPPPPPPGELGSDLAEIVVTGMHSEGDDNPLAVVRKTHAPVVRASPTRAASPAPQAQGEFPAAPPPKPGPAHAEKLGTVHGEANAINSRWTTFERATSEPASVRFLTYDSLENLVATGVLRRGTTATMSANPFPGSGNSTQWHVPDPPRHPDVKE